MIQIAESLIPKWQEKITRGSTYFGIPAMKCPTDVWVYQEIVSDLRPDVIIEIGNFYGGSTLMFAHWLDNLNRRNGTVVAVDVNHASIAPVAWNHPRIRWLTGDATSPSILRQVDERTRNAECVLVVEDSSHEYAQTLDVLRNYGPLVTKGSYLIVEDTICRHGLEEGPDPGPYEAVHAYLRQNADFAIDKDREPYGITWNPDGYLKRVN